MDDTPDGEKARWQFQTLRTLKCRQTEDGFDPIITSLRFVGYVLCVLGFYSTNVGVVSECLFFGQDNGKVFTWELPE